MNKLTINDIFEYKLIAQALSNKTRLKIISLLSQGNFNINEISKSLKMPVPTVTVNVQKLEDCGIVKSQLKSGKHGKQKICKLQYNEIILKLHNHKEEIFENKENKKIKTTTEITYSDVLNKEININIGDFVDFQVNPECGLATRNKYIGTNNSRDAFFSPDKVKSQVIWFNDGYLHYDIENNLSEDSIIESIIISFEACSEHLFFNKNWPSDITLWLNDKEIGTYTSEGHFSSSKGELTPEWWPNQKSQFGELLTFEINNDSSYLNENIISSLNIKNVLSSPKNSISLKLGIKNNAKNSRGIIIFGDEFGSFPQHIKILLKYRFQLHAT